MQMLVPVAFWVFVAVAVVAGIWRQIVFRREIHTTIRLAIEKGQTLDPALIEKLFKPPGSPETVMGTLFGEPTGRPGTEGLLVGGGVILAAGIGLPVLGYFIRLSGNSGPFYPLIGAGILVSLIGIALLILSGLVRSRRAEAASERSSR